MNVAALLHGSPSDDSHRRRQPAPPSSSPQEPGERGPEGGGGSREREERVERGSGGQWGPYDRTRVQSQNQNTWPPPYPSRPAPSSAPSTPITTDISPYAHSKDGPPPASWSQQPIGNPYPPPTPQPPPSAPYDAAPAPAAPSTRIRAGSNAAAHSPPTTGPGVPPPVAPGSSYMPPPSDYPPAHHLSKGPPSGTSTPLYPTPVPVAGQPRLPMSHSPPIGGSPYASGPPPPSSSTPRRAQSQLATPQPPHAHGPPSSHPSPAMASLQNPTLGNGAWGPGVPGPGLVDGRERDLRDRTHPALPGERDRDRDRDMNPPLRDRDRDWDSARDQPRRKQLPTGPGVPPTPLAGPGTGAPPPLGPGVPPIIGPGIPDDSHKISTTSAPGSGVPSRAHSRSQISKDDLMEHGKELERVSRIPEREMPPSGPGRTPDYPPREYPPYRREPGEIAGPVPSNRREREDYIGPGGPSASSSRLPPPPGPPADYRSSSDYRREPPPQDYRRESNEYRPPVEYRREPPHPSAEYRREPPPNDYRREPPPPPAEYRAREGPPPGDYRRDPPPSDYREYRREPPPPVEYRREPPPSDYRREPPPPSDYRGPPDYRDVRRDLPPPGPGHSPEAFRREIPDYRRERDPQDYPSSRRNSNEHRRERDRERDRIMMERERDQRDREVAELRRGEPGSGPGIPPGERQPRRSPHQTREVDRGDPYPRRTDPGEYRREPPPPTQIPGHDYRSGPPPPDGYRSEYRPHPSEYRREPPPPPEFPPRRELPYRRDEYPNQPPHPHGPPPPPMHPSQEYRGPPPPGPPGEYRGPPGPEYRRDVPPGPPPPQEYRREVPPGEYRGPPGSLPPPGDYPPRQGPPPPGPDYRGREPGEIIPGSGSREFPRRERERESRDSGDYARPPGGEYPRRRDETGEYIGRSSQQSSSIPPGGPGVPGRSVTPNTEMFVVKHPDRERDRERWEHEQRGRGDHYPPSQPPPSSSSGSGSGGGPPPPSSSGSAPLPPHPHHSHSHPHLKHVHHHHTPHHHHTHPRVIHSHHPHSHSVHSGPPPPSGQPGGPPGPGGSGPTGSQASPPPGQGGSGGAPPPPSQRQLQGQFSTRFVSVTAHPGSRMGSPVPGPPGVNVGGPGGGGPPGGSAASGSRKDVGPGSGGPGGSVGVGKDMKKMRSGGGGGGPPQGMSGPLGTGRRDRDEREREKDRDRDREIHQPYPSQAPQPVPHRDAQGRVLGHGYPHGPHGPHAQGYDEYMVVDEMEQQQVQQQQQQAQQQRQQQQEQQMRMQEQQQHHTHPHPHAHPHIGHPGHQHPHPHSHQHQHQQQSQLQHGHPHQHQHPHQYPHQHPPPVMQHPHGLGGQVGYYPPHHHSQEGVEELWPREQPDREIRARNRINLGTFVFPNTPFPYFFDVGEWVGVNGVVKERKEVKNGEVKEGEKEIEREGEQREKEKEKTREGEEENKMDLEGEKEKETIGEKEKEEAKDEDKEKTKDKVAEDKAQEQEKDKAGEVQVVEKTSAQKEEEDDMLDVETRATIVIPNGYIPREKPAKPHIWGGGVIGRPVDQRRVPPASSNEDKVDSSVRPRKRRIYTDDSDLFMCALHSGWITWSASARARDKGKDLRIEVRLIRCAGSGAGSVFAVGAGAFAGKYAPAVNGVVAANSALHRKSANGKVPVVRKEEIVGRFIGGWGEKCFVKDQDVETEDEGEDDEENDGRGLVSAGWGSGHDGSAVEVVNAEFVDKGTARSALGLGRRNRSQRLLEYHERRVAVLGLQRLVVPPRLAGRKRRRNWEQWPSTRRLPNATVLDIIPELQEDEMTEDEQPEPPVYPERKEEAVLMGVRTVVFGTGLAGDMRLGYKYQPHVLKDILFPPLSTPLIDRPPPRKRRRTTFGSEDILMDVDQPDSEPPAPTPNRPVILETPKESYLLSLAHGSEFSPDGRKFDISLILEGEVEEDREDAVVLVVADKNAMKAFPEVPPLTPPADEPTESGPAASTSDVAMDGVEPSSTETKSSGDETQPNKESTKDTAESLSQLPSPSTTVLQTDTQPTNTDSSAAGATTTAESLSTTKTVATLPLQSSEDVSMADGQKEGSKKPEPVNTPTKTALKHPVAQVLQRRVGEDMFKFTDEGIIIADGEDSMRTEWLVQVKSWKWATRKIVRV